MGEPVQETQTQTAVELHPLGTLPRDAKSTAFPAAAQTSLHDAAPSGNAGRDGGGDGASADSGDKTVYPSPLKTLLILSGLYMGVFLVALDQTIIGTAIPKITDEFKTIKVRSPQSPGSADDAGPCAEKHGSPG